MPRKCKSSEPLEFVMGDFSDSPLRTVVAIYVVLGCRALCLRCGISLAMSWEALSTGWHVRQGGSWTETYCQKALVDEQELQPSGRALANMCESLDWIPRIAGEDASLKF